MSEQIFRACQELIDDAKMRCADLVFKEMCLEILSRARNVLSQKQHKRLVAYAAESMKRKISFEIPQELATSRL